jgi:hypothetical protein
MIGFAVIVVASIASSVPNVTESQQKCLFGKAKPIGL